MTEPDDRAKDAHPEVTPADLGPEGDVFDESDEGMSGEDGGFAEPEGVATGPAAASAPERVGRASAASRSGGRGSRGGRGPAVPPRVQTASDIAVHIDDRVSVIFVIGVIVIFGLIFLNAVALGKGGLLSPLATPRPIPSASPVASAAPSASPVASAAPSATPGGSLSPSPGASTTPKPRRYWLPVAYVSLAYIVWNFPRLTPTGACRPSCFASVATRQSVPSSATTVVPAGGAAWMCAAPPTTSRPARSNDPRQLASARQYVRVTPCTLSGRDGRVNASSITRVT